VFSSVLLLENHSALQHYAWQALFSQKIADIGSDLMKIAFKIKEDDARNRESSPTVRAIMPAIPSVRPPTVLKPTE